MDYFISIFLMWFFIFIVISPIGNRYDNKGKVESFYFFRKFLITTLSAVILGLLFRKYFSLLLLSLL